MATEDDPDEDLIADYGRVAARNSRFMEELNELPAGSPEYAAKTVQILGAIAEASIISDKINQADVKRLIREVWGLKRRIADLEERLQE